VHSGMGGKPSTADVAVPKSNRAKAMAPVRAGVAQEPQDGNVGNGKYIGKPTERNFMLELQAGFFQRILFQASSARPFF
jgi:hypothetical protein